MYAIRSYYVREHPFAQIKFPGAPFGLYDGRPWFLPFAGAWLKGTRMREKSPTEMAAWIENVILDFIANSPENTLQGPFQEKAFENPLVGFSRGDDPLYESYKQRNNFV